MIDIISFSLSVFFGYNIQWLSNEIYENYKFNKELDEKYKKGIELEKSFTLGEKNYIELISNLSI